MKIALLTDAWTPQVNGVVRTLTTVRTELETMGHTVEVVHPGLFRTIPCPRYPEIRLAVRPGGAVRAALEDSTVDAVHIATEGPIGLAARRLCGRRRIPFTTSYHTQFPLYLKTYAGVPQRMSYAFFRWFHNGAVRTLVPTESMRRELDRRGFAGVRTWTRGVDLELFRPRDQSERDALGLERPVVLYIGRVAAEKNIDAFFDAPLPGGRGTRLVVGDGPIRGRLERDHPEAVFVGFKHGEELARHIASADVFVFPSRTDTFGVVMLEAMACGVPVAAFPVTGPIDVIRDGEVGGLDEDLGAAVERALACDRDAVRRYAETYSWRRCAEIFHDNLEPLRAGRSVGGSD